MEFAVNRRFSGKWMLLTSFGYTWSTVPRTSPNTGHARRPPATRASTRSGRQRLFGDEGKETSTLWNYKVIGRYVLPWEHRLLGLVEACRAAASTAAPSSVTFPGDGTQRVPRRADHRQPRADRHDPRLPARQGFTLPGTAGRVTVQLDVFNLLNSGTVTLFRQTTVNYREVIGILDPRIVRFGVRYDF